MSTENSNERFEQGGSLFDSARSWTGRVREMITGMTSRQLATLARIVALILLLIAIYNGYVLVSNLS